MKILKYITILVILFISLALSLNQKSKIKLRYTIMPIENSEKVFSQFSRGTPKYAKIIVVGDSINTKAIEYLIEKRDTIIGLVNIKIENYTYQLTSFKHKLKNFIYINANITNEEMENKLSWKQFPIIWCDGNSSSWGAVYDIKKNVIIDFQTNGPLLSMIEKI